MTAIETTKAIREHIVLGELNKNTNNFKFDLPPNPFTFGWYPSIRGF